MRQEHYKGVDKWNHFNRNSCFWCYKRMSNHWQFS